MGEELTLGALDTPELRAAFGREVVEANRRRMRVIGPIMIVVHLIHVWVFWTPAAQRATMTLPALRWREYHVWAHGLMVPTIGLLTLLVFRARHDRLAAMLGPIVAGVYLVHGAFCTGSIRSSRHITAYVGYCLGMAVIVVLRRATQIVVYAIGLDAGGGMLFVEHDAGRAVADLPNGVTVNVVGVALRGCSHGAAARVPAARDHRAAARASWPRSTPASSGGSRSR